MTTDTDPPIIWLEPWCEICRSLTEPNEGRTWHKSRIFDPCPTCGKQPTRYVKEK